MHTFTPKLLTVLREGYSFSDFKSDVVAGLTVAIVALPLAMALGVASGAAPDNGLVTAIVAGFLISALGGSRVQIGGPTGAFVVVVFNVIAQHGYAGLILATFLAGFILIAAGYARLGRLIKFVPQPVITGFTAGIAVLIAASQVKEFLGLSLPAMPEELWLKLLAYLTAVPDMQLAALLVGLSALAIIIVLRVFAPKLPGFLFAIVLTSLAVTWLNLPVDTIGSRFPAISAGMPNPVLPAISWVKVVDVLPAAFTIAFLAGIESLLSAVIADGMAGTRHRSNQELVGQGFANIGSALFGGMPATGAIARTATSIRAGARSPVAGIVHAFLLLIFVLFGMDLMAYVPMAALAAILFVVAWGMSEYRRFFALLRMPNGDRAVLLLTFGLTVLVDLTVAIGVGVTVASLLFMARLSETVTVESGTELLRDDELDQDDIDQRDDLPDGVEVFRIGGPIFFGVVGELLDAFRRVGTTPKVVILRMRLVPLLDASGVAMLEEFLAQARLTGVNVILSGVQTQPREMLRRVHLGDDRDNIGYTNTYEQARNLAREIIARRATNQFLGSE